MPYHNTFRLVAYGRETGYLKQYLQQGFDPYDYEYELAEYLGDETDVRDDDGDIDFDKLSEWIQNASEDSLDAFREYVAQQSHEYGGSDRPAYQEMEYRRFVKPTWLVHFTDDPDEIAEKGFIYGFGDYRGLALTTHYTDEVRKMGPGYNFAFVLGSRDAHDASSGKYGQHAVVFWGSGVEAYHYGDEENQLIFWGPDIPTDRIFAMHSGDSGWYVEDATGRTILEGKDFEEAAEWVTNNYRMLNQTEDKIRRRQRVTAGSQDIRNL